LGNEQYTAVTSDADGIYAHGNCIKSALEDLRLAIEGRVERGGYGINTCTRDFEFQEEEYADLVAYWKSDGCLVLSVEPKTITILAS
jgi:hypothetical protein